MPCKARCLESFEITSLFFDGRNLVNLKKLGVGWGYPCGGNCRKQNREKIKWKIGMNGESCPSFLLPPPPHTDKKNSFPQSQKKKVEEMRAGKMERREICLSMCWLASINARPTTERIREQSRHGDPPSCSFRLHSVSCMEDHPISLFCRGRWFKVTTGVPKISV